MLPTLATSAGLRHDPPRRTRRGVLIRSDVLHELTEADVAHLVGGVGVRHVVDLRANAERLAQPRGRLGEIGLRYSELEVLTDQFVEEQRAVASSAKDLNEVSAPQRAAESYREFLIYGRDAYVTALARLVEPGGVPAIVHCTAGKDRTGVLVALLLDAAGVHRDDIVADYAATEIRLERLRTRLAAMPAYAAIATQASAPMMSASAATMAIFLDALDRDHGGATDWFLNSGASREQLQAWQELLLSCA